MLLNPARETNISLARETCGRLLCASAPNKVTSMTANSRVKLSTAFYFVNLGIFFLGTYFWIVHSQYRIMMLYSIFGASLFWLTGSHQQKTALRSHVTLGSAHKWFGFSALVLSAVLILALAQSLYSRPSEISTVMAILLVLLIVLMLTGSKVNDGSFFLRPWFLLGMLTFVVLYAEFSIYFVQPNLMGGPAYASVDAYRDYANAGRILTLSGFAPREMVLEQYYRPFPVVPLQIALMSLVTSLPVNVVHLTLAAAYAILGVICLTLLAGAFTGKQQARLPMLSFLPVLVVILQPILTAPLTVLKPLSFTVPLISLVLYLCLSSVSKQRRIRSYYLVIALLTSIVIPMHPASAAMIVVLLASMALIFKRISAYRSTYSGLAILVIVFFLLYLAPLAAAPLGSILYNVRVVYVVIEEIFRTGPSFFSVLGMIGTTGAVKVDEMNSFLLSVPPALILAIGSVMIVRLVEDKSASAKQEFSERGNEKSLIRHRSFCLFAALLLIMSYGAGYVLSYFAGLVPAINKLSISYVVFPLTPLALLGTTVTLTWIRVNINTARRLLLLGLLILYAISVATSPAFVHENSPFQARLIPIQSERAAASFLSEEYDGTSGAQIVTDWTFMLLVQGELYSEHVSLNAYIPNLLYTPMVNGTTTIMLLRAYYIHNAYLNNQTPYEIPLTDSKKWTLFNKIFDDSSTSVYSGTL